MSRGRPAPLGWNVPPRSLRSMPPGGSVSRSGRRFPTRMKLSPLRRRRCHGVSDLLKASDQASGGSFRIASVEVVGTQVVPDGAVAQHVPDGGEHRGGDGNDGFLGAAARAEATEQCLQVAALDLDRRPSGLNESGFQPVGTWAQSRAAAFAGALVVARAQAAPGAEMSGRGKARHVDPNFCDHRVRADVAQAGNGAQQLSRLAKGVEAVAYLLLDRGDGGIDGVDVPEVQLEHETVVRTDVTAQRFQDFAARGPDACADQGSEVLRIAMAVDDRLQHRAPTGAHDVGEHDTQLEIGVFEHFLDALDVRTALAHELLAGTHERSQVLHRRGWYKTGANQAMGQKIGEPHGVVDVGLAPGYVLDVGGVGQQHLEMSVEDVPHRLPVGAGGFHRDVFDSDAVQPVGERQQSRGRGGESAHFLGGRPVAGNAYAGDDRLLVHIQTGAARIDYFHERLLVAATSACGPRLRTLGCVLRGETPKATVRGTRRAAGPTDIRVRSAKWRPTSVPDAALPFNASFMRRGTAEGRWKN